VWIFTRDDAAFDRAQALDARGVRIFRVEGAADGGSGRNLLSLRDVLGALADEGVTRLLVEGGASIWRAFAAEGLADEVVLFQAGPSAPGVAGDEAVSATLAAGLAPGLDLALASRRRIGADTLSVFRVLSGSRGRAKTS
jgi:diaminohydroxyphosphoribosylaminopyrimidine deaminase/5-amino-6-(5-phosphoribosylamino)uracil reductase